MSDDTRFGVPVFTVDEGARHLGIARSTLRDWTRRPAGTAPLVHRVAPQAPRSASLPFIGAVEAHMLRGLKELGLDPQEIRASVTRLRTITGDEYALATRRVATDGVSLLVDLAASAQNPQWERARDGQGAITEVIERHLKFVTWRGSDRYPIRLSLAAYEGADVVIDPRFAFGQPVLEREKIRVDDIIDAFSAGEDYLAIASEFGVSARAVEAVVRSAPRRRAA